MEDFLIHMIAEVSRQRQVLEVECGLLKDLLKPWPRTKKVLDDCENKEIVTTIQEGPKVSSISLSNEEEQAVSQVHKLLQKAEKTLNLKSKMKQDVEDTRNTEACNSKEIDIESTYKPESSEVPVPKDSSNSNKTLDITENNHRAVTSLSVSSSKIERSSKQTQSSQPESRGVTKPVISTKKNSSVTKEANKDSRLANHKPPSSLRSSSGKTHHVPAHMLAPFKTQENLKFPKHRKTNLPNNISSTRIASKTCISNEYKTCNTLSDIASMESKKSEKSYKMHINSLGHTDNSKIDSVKEISPASHLINIKSDILKEESLKVAQLEQISIDGCNLNYCSTSNLQSEYNNSTNCMNIEYHSVGMDRLSQTKQEATSDLPKSEFQPFNLRKNGSSIKIPGKLIKLVNANSSFRNKLSPSGPVKRGSTSDPAKHFIERLCAQEEISKELRIRTSALTCLKSHQILLDIVQNLYLDQLSENTSMETLYRAKRILEFVLTSFAELQEEADFFSQVKYRQLPLVLDLHKLQNKDQEMPLWLDTEEQKDYEDDLWNHLQTCKRWAHLQFTQKYLQLNILLVKTAQAEWWKILTSQDRSPTVLQGVFGLLATHGHFLPALVQNPDFT